MARQYEINVFTKELRDEKDTYFKVYSTKLGRKNEFYKVKFITECENLELLPSHNRPFVLNVDSDKISVSTRGIKTATGDTIIERKLYVRKINSIGEYIEPDVDIESL